MNPSINCAKCGATVAPGNRFCPTCGADVSGPQGNVATAHVPRAEPARPTITDRALLDALRQATLGEYEILAELGRGGMATVYLAHDLSLDRKVAIKVMAPALLSGEGMVERFKREARTSAQLSHPHIIPIFAVRESEDLVYFVMKFIEGRTLESIIKELGRLPVPMAQSILQQVGGALAYAHRRGVIHRDIKPGNIMIDADGWAVVTDFGIAKVSEAQGLTMTGATVGTPSYMSPEQCAAQEITHASDQYSFGIVAYEMLAGKQPFTGDSIMAIMYQHFNEPPPPLRKARPDCPPELEAAVVQMLAKAPADRFPDLDAAAAAIGGAPLAPDDPIRTQLVTLVADSAQAKMLQSIQTPQSPLPAGKARGKTTRVQPTSAMSLSPARVTVAVGGAVQLTAARRSRAGATLPGDAITWASTDAEVATVDEHGLVTAVAPGEAVITATMGTISATGVVIVTPARAGARRRLVPLLAALVLLAGGGAGAAWYFGLLPVGAAPSPSPAASPPGASADPAPSAPATMPAPVPGPDTATTTVRQQETPATRAPIRSATRRPPAVGVRPSADTLGPRLGAQAARARSDAQSAGATNSELAPGDALVREARQHALDGRRDDALSRFNEALVAWNSVAQAARARTAAAAAAAAPARTEDQPPAAPPPVRTDPRPEIERAIAAYARALESRNVETIRRVYPGLTRRQADAWRGLFESARQVKADLRPSSIQLEGDDVARTTVTGTLDMVMRDGEQNQPITFQATLERAATGWLIREIR